MHFTYTHASIFRVEPCSLDSNQVKLHFGHKIDNGRGLYMKCTHFKFTSFVQQESNNQLIVWQESWAAQIWSRFCGGDPKLLLYIPGFSLVREKKTFAMLTIQVLLLCLIPTSLAQVGVFFIFSKVGLVVEIIITFYQFEQNQWHLLLKVEKRPTNHGCELRSFKTKLFVNIWSTPSHDIKLKIEKTQGQGDEWLGVVMSQLNPRIGQLGADLLNSRVEPVVQVISERHLTYFLLGVWAPMQFWLLIDVPQNQNYPTHDF